MKWTNLILISFFLTGLLMSPATNAQNNYTEKTIRIDWMSWEQAIEKAKSDKKKILVDVYTQSCVWCKRMDQQTFSRPELAAYINANFYPVKFDAQQKKDITYRNKVYRYEKIDGGKGHHELAAEIMSGSMSYPTIVFLDEEQNVIQAIVGFKTAEQFEMIASYFATDSYMKVPWSLYQKQYRSSFSTNADDH